MVEESSTKNTFLIGEKEEAFPKESFRTAFCSSHPEEEDSDSSDGGGISLSIEQLMAYLQAAFNKERRQRLDGQRKFGVCPISEDPNTFLSQKGSYCEMSDLPQPHPLLARSQQFSGDDPKMSAVPSDNPKAKERYPELRLENQLRQNLSLGKRKSVTLIR